MQIEAMNKHQVSMHAANITSTIVTQDWSRLQSTLISHDNQGSGFLPGADNECNRTLRQLGGGADVKYILIIALPRRICLRNTPGG